MTYTAFLALAILRDDFSKLDRSGIIKFLRSCQREDGRWHFSLSVIITPCLSFVFLFIYIVSQPYQEATSPTCALCTALSRLVVCSMIGPELMFLLRYLLSQHAGYVLFHLCHFDSIIQNIFIILREIDLWRRIWPISFLWSARFVLWIYFIS